MTDVERRRYSVSSLMAYEGCPNMYHATFVEGKPPPITPGMRRGTSVHSLIARHMRQPALLQEDIEPAVRERFERFLASRFNQPPAAVEESFVLPFDRGDVHGRIDLILPGHDGGLELVDFKSGNSASHEDLAGHLQLPLYAMAAARKHHLSPEQIAYTYYFLGDGSEAHFQPSNGTFAGVTERVERVMRAIEEGRFEPRPGCTCYACRGEFGRSRQRSGDGGSASTGRKTRR